MRRRADKGEEISKQEGPRRLQKDLEVRIQSGRPQEPRIHPKRLKKARNQPRSPQPSTENPRSCARDRATWTLSEGNLI